MQENIPDFVIDLKKRDSFKPRIEEDNAFRVSSYRPIYCQALDLTRRVVENTKELLAIQQSSDGVGKDTLLDAFQGGFDYANIIAFTGGRGSGKTSLMLSFQKMLANGPVKADFDFQEGDLLKGFQWPKFKAVEPIDPAAFEHKERIIEIFISRLYHDFAKEINRRGGQASDRELTGRILESFRKVLDGIRLLRDPNLAFKDDTNGMDRLLDQLDRLGTTPSLKKSIFELVDSYLEFMLEDKDKQSFLVIAIDDADLNMGNSVQLLEDLRKYLRQPRLLILVAMRQDQILANLSKEFHQQYKDLNDGHRFDDPRNLADAYLRKLIPDTARVMMPFSDLRTKARRVRIKVSGFGGIDSDEKDDRSGYPTLFSYLQQMMRRKLAFTLSDSLYNGEHPFVPDSLRELYDLVNELEEWRDFVPDYDFLLGQFGHINTTRWIGNYKHGVKDRPTFNNHQKLIDFLIQVWSVGKIAYALRMFLIELSNKSPEEINKFIVSRTLPVVLAHFESDEAKRNRQMAQIWDPQSTPIVIPNDRNYTSQDFDSFEEVYSPKANSEHVSVGEVMFLLRLVVENYPDEEIARFIFAIRAIYSMKAMGELFSRKNLWGQSASLAAMIGDLPFTPEIYQIKTLPYVGKPKGETAFFNDVGYLALAKKFKNLLTESEQNPYPTADTDLEYTPVKKDEASLPEKESASLEILGLLRSWEALHYFMFWGGENRRIPRNQGRRVKMSDRLDFVQRYPNLSATFGAKNDDADQVIDSGGVEQIPVQPQENDPIRSISSSGRVMRFSFDHVFRVLTNLETREFNRSSSGKPSGIPPFLSSPQVDAEILSLLPCKDILDEWQWNGLPNFPIWDMEGLQEIMDQFFERINQTSLVLDANPEYRRSIRPEELRKNNSSEEIEQKKAPRITCTIPSCCFDSIYEFGTNISRIMGIVFSPALISKHSMA